ncbi:MAG: hypothetical protein IKA47_08330 [Oscillospiraceae bacterium]|nr:hypothetical protein [Oscillospiraceae bacterium]
MNSKAKGSAGEREFAAVLTQLGYPAHRNDQKFIGGAGLPDVSADGLEAFHFEVKRVERLNVSEAMKQAEADAAGRVPIVAHRRNRHPWLVTLHLDDFLNVMEGGGKP